VIEITIAVVARHRNGPASRHYRQNPPVWLESHVPRYFNPAGYIRDHFATDSEMEIEIARVVDGFDFWSQ
jgi:hypothetical protein